jgi:hypothetical protein
VNVIWVQRIGHTKSFEVALAVRAAAELLKSLNDLRDAWKRDPSSTPKRLSCSASKYDQFLLPAAESTSVTLPGTSAIEGIGAVELAGQRPTFEESANSKAHILKATAEGWRFYIKFVPPIVRRRNLK